jgi:hypothetical protein
MLKLTKIYHTVKNKYLLVISSLDNCEGSPYLYYISKYNYLSSVRNLPINILGNHRSSKQRRVVIFNLI